MKDARNLFDGLEQLDEKSLKFLSKAIDKNNLPGFDYLEYRQSIKAMKDIQLDKETTYKSAYATATTLGLTKEKLLKSARHYQSVLEKEKEQFDQALGKQINEKIAARKAYKKKLLEEKEELKKKIAEIEKKMNKLDEKALEADKEIEQADAKIKEARDRFENTYDTFLSYIAEDIKYIDTVLK